MSTDFTSDCEHHLQMLSAPPGRQYLTRAGHDLFYEFGCRKCPGDILVPVKDVRGKSVEALFEGVLTSVRGGWS